MKVFTVLLLLALSLQLYSQNKIEEKAIQNFYNTCRADKFTALNTKNSGLHFFYTKQYFKSIDRFNKSLEIDDTYCDSWYLIGYSYQQLGDYNKSIESCNKSIKLSSRSVSAYIIKGYSQFYLSDTIAAIRNFETAKEIAPGKIDSYYGLALIKYYQNDMESALNEIDQYKANKRIKASKRDIKALNILEAKLRDESKIYANKMVD